MNGTQTISGTVSKRLKQVVQTFGVILIAIGAPFTINLFCIVPLVTINSRTDDVAIFGVVSLTLALLTLGTGLAAFLQGRSSLKDKPSKQLKFPSHPIVMAGFFIFLLGLGSLVKAAGVGAALFFPPILLAAAALPPLWSVAWMIPRSFGIRDKDETKETSDADQVKNKSTQPSLTWRRGLLSFASGATVSVLIAIALEILLPVIIFAIVFNLADTVMDTVSDLFHQLSNRDIADALTNRGFIYLFVQLAIIAPLAEEIAKPLVVLPLVRSLNKQETFWVGALAGAGFATLENVIYAMSGFYIWAGILAVRALGGALHPLGSGLVAQGWRDVILREKDAGKNWWKRFGIATAVHAVWNGGSLLVITLGGARFFGNLPPEIDFLGLSAAGTTMAFLIILGLSALWIGRVYGHDKPILPTEDAKDEDRFVPTDRAVAIWAVACLIAIVPAGIAGLKLWLR